MADIKTLSERLAAIVEDPQPAAAVGRGRNFARELQREALSRKLWNAFLRQRPRARIPLTAGSSTTRWLRTRTAASSPPCRRCMEINEDQDSRKATFSVQRTPDLVWVTRGA